MLERLVRGIIEKEGKKAVLEVPVDSISVNPYQPRRHFDQKKLEELAKSIKEQGVIQPIIVRRLGSGYELVAGERRLRASKLIGKRTIPAIARQLDELDMIEIAFIENLQREQLNEYEEAEAYARLLKECGSYSEKDLAKRIGKDEKVVHQRLWMLRLPQVIKKAVVSKLISIDHARLLSALADETAQVRLLERIHLEKLSADETAVIIEDMPPGMKRADRGRLDGGGPLEAICSTDSARRLEGCMTALREIISAIRATGIDVAVSADVDDGGLSVNLRFPLDKNNPA